MEEKNMFRFPIYQVLGNRFSILFVNAAGVYYLFDHLADFLNNIELENRLLVANHWDFEVLAYKVGCRALGFIEKLITGPLWRIMNKEKCVLGMSKHYQNLLECFEKWAVDCTSFINNETFCDNSFVSHDECFESLCTPVSNEVQRMTKECLEIIFSGFVVVSRRMLHDHLKGGKYSAITPELEKEAMTVSTTNADPQRDFGMLDRLMRVKPKALDLVYEGVIMFCKNKTAKWRDQLSEESLGKAMQ